MALSKAQKVKVIDAVGSSIQEASTVILVENKGMTVAEVSDLRRKARAVGATYKVAKNRLAKRALAGTTFEHISPMLKGPTAMAVSKDPVAAAKVIVDFAKTNDKLVILGGAFMDKNLDVKGVEALSKMPSLDELRAKIVGILATPATRIATVLQAPASQVARVVSAYSKK
jgi:large subunit ribosomal protein L10